jgi:hypothetical protein
MLVAALRPLTRPSGIDGVSAHPSRLPAGRCSVRQTIAIGHVLDDREPLI